MCASCPTPSATPAPGRTLGNVCNPEGCEVAVTRPALFPSACNATANTTCDPTSVRCGIRCTQSSDCSDAFLPAGNFCDTTNVGLLLLLSSALCLMPSAGSPPPLHDPSHAPLTHQPPPPQSVCRTCPSNLGLDATCYPLACFGARGGCAAGLNCDPRSSTCRPACNGGNDQCAPGHYCNVDNGGVCLPCNCPGFGLTCRGTSSDCICTPESCGNGNSCSSDGQCACRGGENGDLLACRAPTRCTQFFMPQGDKVVRQHECWCSDEASCGPLGGADNLNAPAA